MLELVGFVQKYAWGKLGESSLVGRLSGEELDPQTPYAELWMGVHPNGTSMVKEHNISLKEYISKNPDVLGALKYYWDRFQILPFLLKILSINKALSIQVHPDLVLAERLHICWPLLYKDPNHKPEMAIALTEFDALCAFRPVNEIKDFIRDIPEFDFVITPELLDAYRATPEPAILKKILFSLMTKEEEQYQYAIEHFLQRVDEEAANDAERERYKYSLVKKLYEQFNGDCGVFMVFFLNEVHLEPGEVMYIPPGLPHAYLSGECIECMACSDNVVRAGLTPKYKDIDTLLEMLDYSSYKPEAMKFKKKVVSPYSVRLQPPLPDFGITIVTLPVKLCYLTPYHDSCQIFLVMSGAGKIWGPPEPNPEELDRRAAEPKPDNPLWQQCLEVGFYHSTPPDLPEDNFVPYNDNFENTRGQLIKHGTIMFLSAKTQYCILASEAPLVIYFTYSNFDTMVADNTVRGKRYR